MRLRIFEDRILLGRAAAAQAAAAIQRSLAKRGKARIIGASAASQFEFMEELTASPGSDWKHVELFHLDEYIGLPMTHPASFCRFLQDRLIAKTGIVNFHLLDGEKDPADVMRRTNQAIKIGEGVVYPALHALEREGMLKSRRKLVNGRTRVYYALTRKGDKHLAGLVRHWQHITDAIGLAVGGTAHAAVTL